jgi:hypothetical protein
MNTTRSRTTQASGDPERKRMIRLLADKERQQMLANIAVLDEMLLLQGKQISRLKAELERYKSRQGRLAVACTLATSDESGYNRSVIAEALANDR